MAGQSDAQHALREAVEVLEAGRWSVRIRETVHAGDGTRLAQEAVASGADVAIAAGGDGTVNELVNGLVGTEVALGVLPLGTGNVWAKELGFPGWVPPYRHPLREAAQSLLDSDVRRVDVGRANGRHFLLWTGAGFDAQVTHEVEPLADMKRRLGLALYAVHAFSLAMSFAGTRCTVIIDGQRSRQRVLLAVVSNARRYGGGLFQLAPAACVDDGLLDVFIFRGQGTAATYRHFLSVLAQQHVRDPQVKHYRARRIEIYPDRPIAVQMDGDAFGQTPLVAEVEPRALKVLVPRTAPASLFSEPQAVKALGG